MRNLLKDIANCDICQDLPCGIRPVVQLDREAKIIIIGQAPGKRVHETGIAWNDRSGQTLRQWLGISDEDFYDKSKIAIMAMGFCYPGKGASGDLPPRSICATFWHPKILTQFKKKPLIILIGQYAQRSYLKDKRKQNLTQTVANFTDYLPEYFVLPHPSPRNQNWVKVNPWFEKEVLPKLKIEVKKALQQSTI